MINAVHVLFYSPDADADSAFLRDVLGLPFVDVGHGWLIFGLPPAEVAVHPADAPFAQTHADISMAGSILYFMCDDLDETMKGLAAKHVKCTPVDREAWGIRTSFLLPSGMHVGLYQPTHETAYGLWNAPARRA